MPDIPSGAIVEVRFRDTTALFVVQARVIGAVHTKLALREWIPEALTLQSNVIHVDARYCSIVSMPLNTGRTQR